MKSLYCILLALLLSPWCYSTKATTQREEFRNSGTPVNIDYAEQQEPLAVSHGRYRRHAGEDGDGNSSYTFDNLLVGYDKRVLPQQHDLTCKYEVGQGIGVHPAYPAGQNASEEQCALKCERMKMETNPSINAASHRASDGYCWCIESATEIRSSNTDYKSCYLRTGVRIRLQMYINSFGPVNDVAMDYDADMFLRSWWTDERLRWNSSEVGNGKLKLNLDPAMHDTLWRPDMYISNAKESRLHYVTRDNELIYVWENGNIINSQRVSVKVHCDMDFKYFPFDVQICSIKFESYAFNTDELYFIWKEGNPITMRPGSEETAQYYVEKSEQIDCTTTYPDIGSFTCMEAKFHLRRQINYYVIQTYVPTALLVTLSWLSFLINFRAAAHARVALGITTVLTITTQNAGIRGDLPKVSYVKVIDVWMITCVGFTYLALLQYAFIYYAIQPQGQIHKIFLNRHMLPENEENGNDLTNTSDGELTEARNTTAEVSEKPTISAEDQDFIVTTIDNISKKAFIICFLLFNLAYWTYCLYPE